MLKWVGSLTGIFGALMLSLNNELSMYGYVFMLLSSITLTISFFNDRIISMILQQGIFLIINFIGITQWVL